MPTDKKLPTDRNPGLQHRVARRAPGQATQQMKKFEQNIQGQINRYFIFCQSPLGVVNHFAIYGFYPLVVFHPLE